MDELEVRREKLCLKMAQKTCQTPQVKYMFPVRKEYRNEKKNAHKQVQNKHGKYNKI